MVPWPPTGVQDFGILSPVQDRRAYVLACGLRQLAKVVRPHSTRRQALVAAIEEGGRSPMIRTPEVVGKSLCSRACVISDSFQPPTGSLHTWLRGTLGGPGHQAWKMAQKTVYNFISTFMIR